MATIFATSRHTTIRNHVRHYERAQLESLLSRYFPAVRVTYGIKTGKYRYQGLRSMSVRNPRTIKIALYNIISHLESRNLDEQPLRTAHLFAVAQK